ncbi:MAG: YfhO family protein [Acidobacteriota bacterium]
MRNGASLARFPRIVAREVVLGACLLVSIVAFLFLKPLRARGIFGSDILLEFMPNRAYGFARLLRGEIPLWNPYQFCGYPFVASLQSGIFYPLNMVFLAGVDRGFLWSAIVHVFLAGLIAAAAVFVETGDAAASMLAGTTCMLSGTFLVRIYAGHITITTGFPWLVLTIAAFHRALRIRSRRALAVAGVAFGLQVLSGHPAIANCSVVGLTVLATLHIVREPTARAAARAGVSGISCVVLGGVLAAVQVVPTALYLRSSGRSTGVAYDFATSASFPPEGLVTLVAPGFFGDVATTEYWGRWYLFEVLAYNGIAPLVLVVACARVASSRTRDFAFVAIVTLVLALGRYTSLYGSLYRWIPIISFFRGPGRFLLLTNIAISLGAGFALSTLGNDKTARDRSLRGACALATFISAVLSGAWLILSIERGGSQSLLWKMIVNRIALDSDHFDDVGPLTPSFYQNAYVGSSGSLLRGAFVAAAVAGLMLFGMRLWRRALFGAGMVAITVADLLIASSHYVRSYGPLATGFPRDVAAVLGADQPLHGLPPRIASSSKTEDLSVGSLQGIAHVGGYDPALPRRYVEYVNALAGQPLDDQVVIPEPCRPGRLFRLMGATEVVVSPKDKPPYPDSHLLLEVGDRAIYRLDDPMPRAFIVHEVEVESDPAKRLERLASPEFDARTRAILDAPLSLDFVPAGSADEDRVTVTNSNPERIGIKVSATSPGILVLTDTYDPGWKAAVDGRPSQVVPADHLFRGIPLPAGVHTLELWYDRRPLLAGAAVTLIGTPIVLLAILRGRR